MQIGDRLIAHLTPGGDAATRRAAIHLKLAHAAVDGTRWAAARRHVGIAGDLLTAHPEPGLSAEAAVLDAEIALAADDAGDRARALAESALASPGASAEIRCRALELLGRVRRAHDLDGARDAFEQALATADAAGLAVWRLRALHELGTIDMFDHAGTSRLSEARRIAGELGAASTGAVIDLQLTATAMFRFELDEAERHARSALAASTRLGLGTTGAIVLVFRAEVYALRRDPGEMERFIALARAAAPGDPEIEGSALAGARGMLALLDGDMAGALNAFGRGIAVLDTAPQRGPAPYRGLWPLLLAAHGDPRAAAAIGHARSIGLTVNRANRGLLGYAEAILAGRAGDGSRATGLAGGRRYRPAALPGLGRPGPAVRRGTGAGRRLGQATAVAGGGGRRVRPVRDRTAGGALPPAARRAAAEPLVPAGHHRPAGRRAPPGGRGHLQQGDRGPAAPVARAPWKSMSRTCSASPRRSPGPSSWPSRGRSQTERSPGHLRSGAPGQCGARRPKSGRPGPACLPGGRRPPAGAGSARPWRA